MSKTKKIECIINNTVILRAEKNVNIDGKVIYYNDNASTITIKKADDDLTINIKLNGQEETM